MRYGDANVDLFPFIQIQFYWQNLSFIPSLQDVIEKEAFDAVLPREMRELDVIIKENDTAIAIFGEQNADTGRSLATLQNQVAALQNPQKDNGMVTPTPILPSVTSKIKWRKRFT